MGATRSPWVYPAEVLTAKGDAPAPWSGLPLHVLNEIGASSDFLGKSGAWIYKNHFYQWEGPVAEGSAGGWVLSGITGTATVVLTNVRNGEIALTGDGTGNCDPTLQYGSASLGAAFGYVAGKRMWCHARMKLNTVATCELLFGFATPDTEPTVTNTLPSDGIFLHKTEAGTKLAFDARQDGTSTSRTSLGTALVDDTYATLGFLVDRVGNCHAYQNGVMIASIPHGNANLPDATADVLQFMVGIRGASRTLTMDWLLFGQEH